MDRLPQLSKDGCHGCVAVTSLPILHESAGDANGTLESSDALPILQLIERTSVIPVVVPHNSKSVPLPRLRESAGHAVGTTPSSDALPLLHVAEHTSTPVQQTRMSAQEGRIVSGSGAPPFKRTRASVEKPMPIVKPSGESPWGVHVGHHFMEVFSPPRIALVFRQRGYRAQYSFDLLEGHDLLDGAHRQMVRDKIKAHKPKYVMLSPPCTVFSQMQHSNESRRTWETGVRTPPPDGPHSPQPFVKDYVFLFIPDAPSVYRNNFLSWTLRNIFFYRWWYTDSDLPRKDLEAWARKVQDHTAFFDFALEIASLQHTESRYFVLEHPAYATSWGLPQCARVRSLPGIEVAFFHQCMFGAVTKVTHTPILKPTKLMTNCPQVVRHFDGKFCDHTHDHQRVHGTEGGETRAAFAAIYPFALCEALADCMI
jgi:hypothetical protein